MRISRAVTVTASSVARSMNRVIPRLAVFTLLAGITALTLVPGLVAQEMELAFVSPEVASTQPVPGEKSPVLAGALSGLLFPGLGSFYAGDSPHGVRHAVIAGVTIVGMIAGSSECELFDQNDDCVVTGISALLFIGNWVWAIVVGVNDANDYNRSLSTAGLQFSPQLIAVRSEGRNTVGLQLIRYGL